MAEKVPYDLSGIVSPEPSDRPANDDKGDGRSPPPYDMSEMSNVSVDASREPVEPARAEGPQDAGQKGKVRSAWTLLVVVILALAVLFGCVEFHRFVSRSFDLHPFYGWLSVGLSALLGIVLCIVLAVEAGAYWRLGLFREVREGFERLRTCSESPGLNRKVQESFYRYLRYLEKNSDDETLTTCERLKERMDLAADALEWEQDIQDILLAPMDGAAQSAIEEEARNVAFATAISPRGFLDAALTLWRNVRLVRRIAEVYRIRPGLHGTFLIMRRVLAAVAVAGVGEMASQGLLSNIAGFLRFIIAPLAQALANATMTVRVGIIAQDECRPLALPPEKREQTFARLYGAAQKTVDLLRKEKPKEPSGMQAEQN